MAPIRRPAAVRRRVGSRPLMRQEMGCGPARRYVPKAKS
jgi:hypothetical protein